MKTEIPMPKPRLDHYGLTHFTADARLRAMQLLWEHLSDEQKTEYNASGYTYFRAKGNDTGCDYEIYYNAIKQLGADGFCLHVGGMKADASDTLPYEDALLARKLLIECDEDLFLRVANSHSNGRPLRR